MSFLCQKDSIEVNAIIIKAINDCCYKYNLLAPGQDLSCFRVSNAGNILMSNKILISNNLISYLNMSSKNDIKELMACLKENSLKEILVWIEKFISNYSCSGSRELTVSDFDFTYQVEEKNKEFLQSAFLQAHQKYINSLEKEIKEIIKGLGEFEDLIPVTVLSYLKCAGTDLKLIRKRFKYFIRCTCGLEAEADLETFKCRLLNNQEEQIIQCVQNVTKYCLDKYKEHQIPVLLKNYDEQVDIIERDYFLNSSAYLKLSELKTFKETVEGQRKIEYFRHSNKWIFGSKTLPSITPERILSLIQETFRVIQNGKLFLKTEAQERIREIWITKGREKFDECNRIWSALPFTVKLFTVNLYKQFKIYTEECSKGNVHALNGRLIIGGTEVETINEESIINAFQSYINKIKKTADSIEPDRDNAYSILKVIESSLPKKMGITTVAAVLTGSRARKVIDRGLNKNAYYGALKNISQIDIINQIKRMIESNILKIRYIGRKDLPILCLTDETKKLITSLSVSEVPEIVQENNTDEKSTVKIEDIVNRRAWDILEKKSKKDFSAEAILKVAAVLWPTGKAAKIVKAL